MPLYTSVRLILVFFLLQACDQAQQQDRIADIPMAQLSLPEIDERIISDPGNAALFARRALLQEQRDSLNAARKDWLRAIALDSTVVTWRIGLGDLLYRTLDIAKAEEQFLKAVALAPDSTEARLKIAEIRLVQREYIEAMRWTNEALRLDQENAKAYFLKGWIHREAGDTALAISSYHTAVERDPGFYDAYIALGLIHANKNDPLAMEFYNTALEIRPESVEAWYDRGMFAQSAGMDSVAIASYAKIKEIDPKNAAAWYNTGYVLLEHQGRNGEARREFTQAIRILPTYSQAYYNRGLTYELDGKLDSAVSDYRRSLALLPDFDLPALGLSRMQEKGLKVE